MAIVTCFDFLTESVRLTAAAILLTGGGHLQTLHFGTLVSDVKGWMTLN